MQSPPRPSLAVPLPFFLPCSHCFSLPGFRFSISLMTSMCLSPILSSQVGREASNEAEVSNPGTQASKAAGGLMEEDEFEEARLAEQVCSPTCRGFEHCDVRV